MTGRILHRIDTALERFLPEQRLFLRSEHSTRFMRLSPTAQAAGLAGGALVVAWAMLATSFLLIDQVGSGNLRDQAKRDQALYDTRLNALAAERDAHAAEVRATRERFEVAMAEVSRMQSVLLDSEERRRELETGMNVLTDTLRTSMAERDAARTRNRELAAALEGDTPRDGPRAADVQDTLAFLTAALDETAAERDTAAADATAAYKLAEALAYEHELMAERNDQIFASLEEALTVSVEPLDKMFAAAGLSADDMIERVRQGYSGVGGPLTPIAISSKGDYDPSPEELRARALLERMDELNLYRIAAEKLPFAQPLRAAYRYTSPFGKRRHPITGAYSMHEGADFAAAYGTPIHATADGVVTRAGWVSGYGRFVEIRHEFGLVTRYGHMAKIRVKKGQRVSRGDRIGDMGNSGRSTGTHLHYEVRVDGKPVNPMTYIKAARDVF
ncbi:Murein DD-endopeptidase MepM and murein hydrolase activator NlpD, contain LysM domain [Rhodovulum sp. ES.010]|uniref:M23 family metallopeptidase n=1 Tax=Rhodovulum sp. ES.010 TaxID=1882821 RepID=UPI00092949BE|nr:M23 family metallopeptidase [Rhodovulum sp. ES.010]SIO08097.1 Murein DD-endopeptidase MepM and murein hydrolase activator NlpD, contain LysM domain [Rhodovulum sp. ES.010]